MQSIRSNSHGSAGSASQHSLHKQRDYSMAASTGSGALRPLSANAPMSAGKSASAVVRSRREREDGLTHSFAAEADVTSFSTTTPTSGREASAAAQRENTDARSDTSSVSSSPPPPPAAPALSPALLSRLQVDYPAVYTALQLYDRSVRHHKAAYRAKEAELLRCINVGEELLEQMDALRQRCGDLARERDDAVAASSTALTVVQDASEATKRAEAATNAAAAAAAAAEAVRRLESEKQGLLRSHEAQCTRFREQLQEALQQASQAALEKRDVEATLQQTRARLHRAEEVVVHAEEALRHHEAAHAAQLQQALQQQQRQFAQQLAAVKQQADVGKETVLAEATVEMERLQRALQRTERELEAFQRQPSTPPFTPASLEGGVALVAAAHTQHSGTTNTTSAAAAASAAVVEMAALRRQIRQLEDVNHDLQLQLRRRASSVMINAATHTDGLPAGERKGGVGSSSAGVARGVDSVSASVAGALTLRGSDADARLAASAAGACDGVTSGALLQQQQQLQEENERLRRKLQEVSRQAQDEVDRAHEARLAAQQQVKTTEAQMQLLRSTVVGGLEEELQRTRERVDAIEAHSAELQEVADAFEQRTIALEAELQGSAATLTHTQEAARRLQDELQHSQAAQQHAEAQRLQAEAAAEQRSALVVQLQREKQQLLVALRTLQAQTGTIEEALQEVTSKHQESAAALGMDAARLEERCVLLEHQLEEAREERVALCTRLRDAEEAIDVLKDAQRLAQETARTAQRRLSDAEDAARSAGEQRQRVEQALKVRVAAAEQESQRLLAQLHEATRRVRDQQEAAQRHEEALRQSNERAARLAVEARELREMHSGREDAARDRWREQYAINAAERERLLADREQELEEVQRQLHEVRSALAARDDTLGQLQRQRQQAQASLADAVADSAAHKGRAQALAEELARVEADRRDAKAELRRLREQASRGEQTSGGGAATAAVLAGGGASAYSTVPPPTNAPAAAAAASSSARLVDLESRLLECEGKLRSAERQRQQLQRTLLELVLPTATEAAASPVPSQASVSHAWEMSITALHDAVARLTAYGTSPASKAAGRGEEVGDDDDDGSGNDKDDGSAGSPAAIYGAAAATALQSLHDVMRGLHEGSERRWAAVREAVLSAFALPAQDSATTAVITTTAAKDEKDAGSLPLPHSPSQPSLTALRESMETSLGAFVSALGDAQTRWADARAQITAAARLRKQRDADGSELARLRAVLADSEAARATLQTSLDSLAVKLSSANRTNQSLEAQVDQLQQDARAAAAQVASAEQRLEKLRAEAQAERAEWVGKWQESQRHRDREKTEHEAELTALRRELAAAEGDASHVLEGQRRQFEEAQRQLRAELHDLHESSTATEAALRQQVGALTQEKAELTQGLRRAKAAVAELEKRVTAAEAAFRAKEAELAAAQQATQEARRALQQTLANGAAADAFGQQSLTSHVATLQSQLRTCRQEAEQMAASHAAERAELQALRKVNAALESRLAEVEEDRAPLRQQLHSLLSFSEGAG